MPSRSLAKRPGKLITGKELAAMPDLGRCELVRGRIIAASPTFPDHGLVEGRFFHELYAFVEPRKLGVVLVGEVGIYTGRGPDTVRGADVLFISHARYAQCKARPGFLQVAPELVVEVLSASERPRTVERKLREYFAAGVIVVWVADPRRRTVKVCHSLSDVRTLGPGEELTGGDVLPGFRLEVLPGVGDHHGSPTLA